MENEVTFRSQWHFNGGKEASLKPDIQEIAESSSFASCEKHGFYQTGKSEDIPRKSTRSYPLDPRLRRIRANNRERRRIQAINDAMEALRRVIPNTNNKRKLTKLELLRLAQDYIRDLSETLHANKHEYVEEIENFSCTFTGYNNFFGGPFHTK